MCILRVFLRAHTNAIFFVEKHLQRVDGHAGPLLHPDGAVLGGRRALLVGEGDADGHRQAARQHAVVARIDGDDNRSRSAHRLT